MAKVKSPDVAAAKWKRRAGNAGPEYEEGVRNPRADWATETKNAEAAYDAGVQKAISEKRFGKGVNKAGTAKWQQAAVEKGPARYQQGVELAQANYEQGVAPYMQALASLTLPPRGPKGDVRNLERVKVVTQTLHQKKQSLRGGA